MNLHPTGLHTKLMNVFTSFFPGQIAKKSVVLYPYLEGTTDWNLFQLWVSYMHKLAIGNPLFLQTLKHFTVETKLYLQV